MLLEYLQGGLMMTAKLKGYIRMLDIESDKEIHTGRIEIEPEVEIDIWFSHETFCYKDASTPSGMVTADEFDIATVIYNPREVDGKLIECEMIKPAYKLPRKTLAKYNQMMRLLGWGFTIDKLDAGIP